MDAKQRKAAGVALGELLAEKHKHYGDSKVADIIYLLYPDGIPVKDYPHLLTIVRILDKIGRIVNPNRDTDKESPFWDIAGYGILGTEVWENDKKLAEYAKTASIRAKKIGDDFKAAIEDLKDDVDDPAERIQDHPCIECLESKTPPRRKHTTHCNCPKCVQHRTI